MEEGAATASEDEGGPCPVEGQTSRGNGGEEKRRQVTGEDKVCNPALHFAAAIYRYGGSIALSEPVLCMMQTIYTKPQMFITYES